MQKKSLKEDINKWFQTFYWTRRQGTVGLKHRLYRIFALVVVLEHYCHFRKAATRIHATCTVALIASATVQRRAVNA